MKTVKIFEGVELQALSGEDDLQIQKQLAKQLGVRQQAVSDRPREIRKIQKIDRWVPPELNDREMEKRKNTRDICTLGTKGSRFCVV